MFYCNNNIFYLCNYIHTVITNSSLGYIQFAAVMLILMSLTKIFLVICHLCHCCCNPCCNNYRHNLYFDYFVDLGNWLEMPLYVSTLIFAVVTINSKCGCIENWEWSIGIAAVFLAWASLILFMRKLEIWGIKLTRKF